MTSPTSYTLAEPAARYASDSGYSPVSDETEESRRAWMRLANLQFTARLTAVLLQRFGGDPRALFTARDAELESVPGFAARHLVRLRDPAYEVTPRQWNWMERYSVRLLLLGQPDYPPSLREIPDPPPILFVRGTLAESDRFGIGIVGSRHATPYGRATAERLARELSEQGVATVSGGAVGIDAAAHRGAVEGGGRTIAILGCGLDVDYPRENRALFELIREHGALMTEYPLGAQPEAWRFPLRNRIISGLTLGVLVVEAPWQSGALITARCAAEHGRPVMAVPGNIDRPSSAGCNELLKDGAILVTGLEDILHAVGVVPSPARREHQRALDFASEVEEEPTEPARAGKTAAASPAKSSAPTAPTPPPENLSEPQRRLLACLSLTPCHIDGLAQKSGLTAMEASVELTLLELNGLARRLPGNTYIRGL